MKEIYRLLGELKKELRDKEKMDYSELKEKVDVIESEYKDITENITIKMVDLKKSMTLIGDIESEVNSLINKLSIREDRIYTLQYYLRLEDNKPPNFDDISFPDWEDEDGSIQT